jgi:hypothetical protein
MVCCTVLSDQLIIFGRCGRGLQSMVYQVFDSMEPTFRYHHYYESIELTNNRLICFDVPAKDFHYWYFEDRYCHLLAHVSPSNPLCVCATIL